MKILKQRENYISDMIWIYLFISPILDVITSFSIHYMGKSMPIILGIKLFFLFFLFILNVIEKEKKSIWYSMCLFIYFLFFLFIMIYEKGLSSTYFEMQSLFRTFYFPCSFLFLYSLQKKKKFVVEEKKLCFVLFLYLFFLVVPELFQFGFQSYAITKAGGLGFFYSTNEISGILAILGPFLLSYLKNKNWIMRIFLFLLYLAGILVIGTKVPILAFCITIFCFLLFLFKQLWKRKEFKKFISSISISIIGLLCFIGILFTSSFYQNIKTHLDFLEIKEVSDLFTFHHIDHFIFSERLSFLQDTSLQYQNSSWFLKTVGIGITKLDGEAISSMKMIEMDYFDVFYHYGILGMFLFFLPFFFISWKRNYLLEEKISIFLIFLLALFSGHILVAPSVSILVACVLLEKKEVIE